ncbi:MULTISPECIES: DUF2887 domain-containing protein [unclassified Thermosynechococcus]|uniref:DUF2887 domain-containing protein n=1 Tax=unclassified Thermosynechococcus TaxID=2622553 RepID=UPI00197DBF58|nr:DUF2887 domain-containing protein [Thermosynechococcus sp. TA-1]WKT86767.1 DUF2887 domain-containing protein [Thermosynechococcus sp. JY1339]WNC25253.1 DUF2887 domain-containing protein [Thermosynechococcus sp. PP551]WNC27831.1 DUF2887 domain-containing protein [Thermosynechococcus sp. PP555]WNC55709.1 DUF2887 domain-containing protein [Thermosynechococcus sp. JY1331]
MEQVSFEPYEVLVNSHHLHRVYLNELGSLETLPLSLALMQLTVLPEAKMPTAARLLAERTRTEAVPRPKVIIELYGYSNHWNGGRGAPAGQVML